MRDTPADTLRHPRQFNSPEHVPPASVQPLVLALLASLLRVLEREVVAATNSASVLRSMPNRNDARSASSRTGRFEPMAWMPDPGAAHCVEHDLPGRYLWRRRYQIRSVFPKPERDVRQQLIRLSDALLDRRVVDVFTRVIRHVAFAAQRIEHGDPSGCQTDCQREPLNNRGVMPGSLGVRPISV